VSIFSLFSTKDSDQEDAAVKLFLEFANESPNWTCLLDPSGRILAVNQAGKGFLGLEKSFRPETGLLEFWPEAERRVLQQALEAAVAGHSTNTSLCFPTPTGQEILFSAALNPVNRGGTSGITWVAAVFSDVTSWRRKEEALQRTLTNRLDTSSHLLVGAEHRFRAVVEGSPQWISIFSEDGRIQTINPAGREVLGIPENLILNRFLWEFFDPIHRDEIAVRLQGVFSAGKAALELNLEDPSGNIRVLFTVLKPMAESSHSERRLVGIFTDITDQKKAETILRDSRDQLEIEVRQRTIDLHQVNEALTAEIAIRRNAELELRKAMEMADSANKAKSEFLANMSHEIRTPMNSVLGFTALLLRTSLTPKQRDYAETVQNSGRLLLTLLDDILDLSKIEAGKLTLEELPFNLKETFREVMAMFRPKADEKKLLLSLFFPAPPQKMVVGDSTRLHQILINLVGNAVKFTTNGQVKVVVSHSRDSSDAAPTLKVRVEDTGIGISSEHIDRLFQKFSQADASTKRRFGGTGLGLAISKLLVEKMSGIIGVNSQEGIGSTFFFSIPLPYSEESAVLVDSGEELADQAFGDPLENTKARILLVEDDFESCRFISKCLDSLDCEVLIVSSGKQAVECSQQEKFDLILMDWQLPELDGISATRAIRKPDNPNFTTPVIAVTAMAMKGDREKCFEAGMNAYLPKPIDLNKLEETVKEFLEKGPPDNSPSTQRKS
jgi:PAS domain S-box-containing protein